MEDWTLIVGKLSRLDQAVILPVDNRELVV